MDFTPDVVVKLVRGVHSRRVSINSSIDEDASTKVVRKLRELDLESAEPILLEINSDGGKLENAAFLIIENIAMLRSPTVALVYGQCYSAAFLILQFCTHRYALQQAHFVIHNNYKSLMILPNQSLEAVEEVAKVLYRETQSIREKKVSMLRKRLSHLSRGELIEMMDKETHLDSYQAKNLGMIDGIVDTSI